MYQIYPNAKIHIFFNLESPKKIAQKLFLNSPVRKRAVSRGIQHQRPKTFGLHTGNDRRKIYVKLTNILSNSTGIKFNRTLIGV